MIWILKDSHALVVLASFTLVLTFTQRQAWCMLQGFVSRRSRPVQLMDDTCSGPLQHLSQLEALKEVIWTVKYGIHKVGRLIMARRANIGRGIGSPSLEPTAFSLYFDILTLTNICAFVVAGVAVP